MVTKKVKTVGIDPETLSREKILLMFRAASQRADRYHFKLKAAKKKIERLEAIAFVDELTGVPNRRAFTRALEDELARAKRGLGKPVALALLDIDFFKRINDGFGHPVGDLVLMKMGELLRRATRRTDFVGRIGGEEFAFILPGTGREGAQNLIERFRSVVENELRVVVMKGRHKVSLSATASFGIAVWGDPDDGIDTETTDDLFGRADRALYAAKAQGRNRVVFLPRT